MKEAGFSFSTRSDLVVSLFNSATGFEDLVSAEKEAVAADVRCVSATREAWFQSLAADYSSQVDARVFDEPLPK
jgi:hypothetical protein